MDNFVFLLSFINNSMNLGTFHQFFQEFCIHLFEFITLCIGAKSEETIEGYIFLRYTDQLKIILQNFFERFREKYGISLFKIIIEFSNLFLHPQLYDTPELALELISFIFEFSLQYFNEDTKNFMNMFHRSIMSTPKICLYFTRYVSDVKTTISFIDIIKDFSLESFSVSHMISQNSEIINTISSKLRNAINSNKLKIFEQEKLFFSCFKPKEAYETATTHIMDSSYKKICFYYSAKNVFKFIIEIMTHYHICLSIRQCECFSNALWISENKIFCQKSNIFHYRYSSNSFTSFEPSTRLLGSFLQLSNTCSKHDYSHGLFINGDLKIQTSPISYPCICFIDPSVYSHPILNSGELLYQVFFQRFFKFGLFKCSYNSCFCSPDYKIPVVSFLFSPAILVLFFAEVTNDSIHFIQKDSNNGYESFQNSLFHGDFGSFTIFCGHPVLIVNTFDAYYYKSIGNELDIVFKSVSPMCFVFADSIPLFFKSNFFQIAKF